MSTTGKRTEELIALDKLHVWHPFTQQKEWVSSEQLVIERGNGNYLFDTDGKKYLDGVSSLWVTVHGHRKREIDRAVREQLKKIAHTTLLGLSSVPSIELAAKLVKITPRGLNRVFYSDSGSTAVEIALKIAYQYWVEKGIKGKNRFITFTGAYHGDTLGSMGVGEIGPFVKKFNPLLKKHIRAPYPYCYRCPVKSNKKEYPECGTACLGDFERILEKHHEEAAACIIEPLVQGAAGMITSPPGFLKGVRRLTKKYGVLLIADEVAVGFGRTGKLFACEHEGVSPDIMALAKGITGGYLPLAATLTTEKIYRAFLGKYEDFKAFLHGHTYTGNPLGCAAAIANLNIFENDKVIEGIQPKIELLSTLLGELKEHKYVGDIRQRGLMVGIELVADKHAKEPFPTKERLGHAVCVKAREYGLIIRPLGDVIILMPPLSIKDAELKKIVRVVRDSINACIA